MDRMDTVDDFMMTRPPTARRPLLGLTVLVVEDSRFACEAVRLLCLRSGARIRRADSLEHARRHLGVYRPSVLIVDIGLPDGSGLDLIRSSAAATPRIDVILGTSGDTDMETPANDAGADGFIGKPIASLSAFQAAILAHLPLDRHPPGPRLVTDEIVNPDIIAYHDDLSHVVSVIDGDSGAETLGYITQFLGGVARSVADNDLDHAVTALAQKHALGSSTPADLTALGAMVQSRLATVGPL
jgi:CheY-like chemotaxis protein